MIKKNNVFTGKIVTNDWADQVLENIGGEGYEAIILDEGVDVEIIEPRSEKNDFELFKNEVHQKIFNEYF